MDSQLPATADADVPSPEPLSNLFLERCRTSAERIAGYAKLDGRWVGFTWAEVRAAVEEIALGLVELGAKRGDAIGVLSNTRREWGLADQAITLIGGITIGIYPTLTQAQTKYLVDHAGVRVIFVEDRAQRVKVQEVLGDRDLKIIVFDADEPEAVPDSGRRPSVAPTAERVIGLPALRRLGAKRRLEHPDELERRASENKSSDVVTYVYTSGTTGEPKGAMITHANFHYVVHATSLLVPYNGERSLVFLPLAHSLQRYVSYLALIANVEAYYAESIEKVPENIREVHPTCFAVVPRVLEKIHARVMSQGRGGRPWKVSIFEKSLAAMHFSGQALRDGKEPGLRARIGREVASRLVGERIREGLGGRVKFLGCGSAPLARDVHEFFEDLGIPVLEGYGLTETSAPATLSTLSSRRIGMVGRPIPGTYVKIASDGEILVKGPGVFQGYFNSPEATKDAFTDDGWFKTGDIGKMSRDGFLQITDRKKDLIITSGGKNCAPQPIEHALKRDMLISQAVVIGDRRPYLSALFVLDPEATRLSARELGLRDTATPEEVSRAPAFRARMDAHVEKINSTLAPFEQIKRWDVLPAEMTIESGELTPTLKVKRRVVYERYAERIERLYGA
ncbi:MAG: long-chain fatty acid--CoA ligase [Deltaproteobacteria bacterium]|nr:long-chain fatty acid--CoA ligase [Deltaproteobacteria bacterium]